MASNLQVLSGIPADDRGTLELAADGLAAEYRTVAGDQKRSQQERDAAESYVEAASQLEEADSFERALMSASQAVERFRGTDDKKGLADARRLLVHAYCCQAERLRYAEGEACRTGVRDALQAGAQLAAEQAADYKAAGDKRGEASMLLSLAEVNYSKRGEKTRQEAEALATEGLKLARELGDKRLEAVAQALLASIGLAGSTLASEHAKLAHSAYRKIGDKRGEAKALHLLGASIVKKGKLEEGVDLCLEAAARFREVGARKLEAFEYFVISQFFLSKSMGREAAEYAEDALAIFKATAGCSSHTAHAFNAVVQAHIVKGDQRQAARAASEGLEFFKSRQDRRGQAITLAALATAHAAKEELEQGITVAEEAQSMCQDIGDQRWEGAVLRELAVMQLQRNSAEEASQLASEAVSMFQSAGDRIGEASALSVLVQVHTKKGDYYAAVQVANEQRAIFQETGDRSREASALLVAAGCLSSDQSLDQALSLAEEALEISQEMEDLAGEARALGALAETYARREDSDPAVEKALEMRQKAKESGDRLLEASACKVLSNVHQTFERPVEAVRAANEAVALAKKAMYKPAIVDMMLLAVQVNVSLILRDGAQGSARGVEKALRPAKEAVTVAKATGKKSLISTSLFQLGEVQLMSYKLGLAMAAAKEALEIFREAGDGVGEAAAVILMAETHYAGGRHDKAEETVAEGIQLAQACSDKGKEQYASQLLDKIKESRRVVLAPVMQHMVPMASMAALPQAAAPGAAAVQEVSEAPKQVGLDAAMVSATVQEMARQAIGVDDELFQDSALMDSGMDSLTAVSFRNGLQQNLGVKLPSSLMFDYPTMKEVANRIVELSIERA